MSVIEDNWDKILETVRVEHEIMGVSFETWLKPLKVYHTSDDKVTILVPMEKAGFEYINKKYKLPLQAAIGDITGKMYEVEFVMPEDIKKSQDEKDYRLSATTANLNPKYTFDTFVVGSNNQFAHAASLAVAEAPGEVWNPLFLYGGSGLGKTHLMNSIAHFILKQDPSKKVLYITSEDFTNEVIEAIRNGSSSAMSRFRNKYRNIDVLLIDDIQFIIGKESTQEEFFHTFNALHTAGKQIVISSDRQPKDMDILEERIRSRFEWGLLADIQRPNYETRMAILRKKEEMDGYNVKDEVIEYIAKNIKSNIRELEGSLNKIIAYANFVGKDIDLSLAQAALEDMISPDEKRIITPDFIISIVADQFDITTGDIKGSKRTSKIAHARQLTMYLVHELTDSPLTSIGKILGGKDHTTVGYGIDKIKKEVEDPNNHTTEDEIDMLKKKLNV